MDKTVIVQGSVFVGADGSWSRDWQAGVFEVEELACKTEEGPTVAAVVVADHVVHCTEHATMGDARAKLEEVTPMILERARAASAAALAKVE